MKRVIVIPARLGSSRFPDKPLAKMPDGKTLLEWTYAAAVQSELGHVVITSPDKGILEVARDIGATWFPSTLACPTGTHRAAEIDLLMRADQIVVWQVDEPCVPAQAVDIMFRYLEGPTEYPDPIVTLVAEPTDEEWLDPNLVSVAVSLNRCHWFMRRPELPLMGHVGIYGFNSQQLRDATHHPPSELAEQSQLEQLTWLELGMPIIPIQLPQLPPAVNVYSDIKKVGNFKPCP